MAETLSIVSDGAEVRTEFETAAGASVVTSNPRHVICQAGAVRSFDIDPKKDSSVDVCVYCGSSSGRDPAYGRIAADLGRELAERDIGLVYGGGRIGLMGIVADAVLDAGGRAHGIIPEHLVAMETAHSDLTSLEVVDSMHERKARMADRSTGFIVLPGGLGTFDEVFEILTWNQLGLIAKPVVFLDVEVDGVGYFDPLFTAFGHMVSQGFVNGTTSILLQRSTAVVDAVDRATTRAPSVEGKLSSLDVTSKRSLR